MTLLALLIPAAGLSHFQSVITTVRFTPPSGLLTKNRMLSTLHSIQDYMKNQRQAPPNLSVIRFEDTLKPTIDEWDHPLQYSVDQNGVITLTSLGADGKPGGEGRDKDIIKRYRTKDADGNLIIFNDSWIHYGEINDSK